MGILKKIIKFNLSKAEEVIENDKNKKRHELISDEEFMSSYKATTNRINNLRKSIRNTEQ